jgi:anti-sigma-K factor RskA
MVAAFMVEGIKTPLVATYDSANGRLSMPGPMPIPQGKSAQLWAIVGTAAPRPLGLFHEAGTRVEADARSATPMAPGTTFAISLEPIGGSPTGAPTGPVVASATLIRA